jgi:uncharacterized protein
MPFVKHSCYKHPPRFLFNGHLQTIFPSYRRVSGVTYQRERITTPDDDFLDLDWVYNGSRQLVILTHGLEGNSTRPYMMGMAKAFSEKNYDVVAWNCRSCSGEMNRQFRLYNHGEIGDIELVLNHALSRRPYDSVHLVGFSMGGNISLKFAAVKMPPSVKSVVAFSAPLCMESSIAVLDESSQWLYKKKFQSGLMPKAIEKAKRFPNRLSLSEVKAAFKGSWEAQQELFFVKINGYNNLNDFFQKGAAIHFIPDLKIPALIVQAKNDPLLSPACFPTQLAENHAFIHLEAPCEGGHCGFPLAFGHGYSYAEKRAVQFVEKINAQKIESREQRFAMSVV